jgi:4-amino-4-deoxy-L-arabinose transferase-like glycosyltransferase
MRSATLHALPPPSHLIRRPLEAAFLFLLCALPVLLYIPFMGAPFERDEGVYATIAQGLLDGQVPYRDLFDNKPPLVYGWYAFSFTLFGESVVAPRLIAALLLSATTFVIFSQARMIFPRGVAYGAAGAFAISTGLPFVALHANTEAYMIFPLVMSLVAFTAGVRDGRLGWFLLAGVFAGVAIMTKQVAMWNLLALAVLATFWTWRSLGLQWRSVVPAALLLAGATAVAAAVALPFAIVGALNDLYYANVSYNMLYVDALSYGERAFNLAWGVGYFLLVAGPLVAGAFIGLMIVLRRRLWPADYLIVLWAVASVIGVASGGRFFPHYFLHLVPALAVLTAVAVYNTARNWRQLRLTSPVVALILVLVVISVGANAVLYVAPIPVQQRVAETVYEQRIWEEQSRSLAAYIQERTSPDDTIFNFGRESQLYFYSDRRPAVRYFYEWAFWYNEKTFAETIEALREARPAYIIDSSRVPEFNPHFERYPAEFSDFLEQEYQYVGRIYFADVYMHNSHDPEAATGE